MKGGHFVRRPIFAKDPDHAELQDCLRHGRSLTLRVISLRAIRAGIQPESDCRREQTLLDME